MEKKPMQNHHPVVPAENHYDDAENTKIKSLRERLQETDNPSDWINKDSFLIKWIRGAGGNTDKAFTLLETSMQWRKDNEVDGIHKRNLPPGVKEILPYAFLGLSPKGYGVALNVVGRHCPTSVIKHFGSDTLLKAQTMSLEYQNEQLRRISEETGVDYTKTIAVTDIRGFTAHHVLQSMKPIVFEHMKKLSSNLSENYPEQLAGTVVINAPKIYTLLYKAMKPFLPSGTADRFQIFGKNNKEWTEHLKQICGTEILPPFWGGTRQGSDQYCSEIWYMKPADFGQFLTGASSEEKIFVVKSTGQFEEVVKVETPGTILNWSFRTVDHDINFNVIWRTREGLGNKGMDVVPLSRVESHIFEQFGVHVSPSVGEYRLIFDNKYSRYRNKIVFYRIWLE